MCARSIVNGPTIARKHICCIGPSRGRLEATPICRYKLRTDQRCKELKTSNQQNIQQHIATKVRTQQLKPLASCYEQRFVQYTRRAVRQSQQLMLESKNLRYQIEMLCQGHRKKCRNQAFSSCKAIQQNATFCPAAKHYKLQAYGRAKPPHRAVVMSKIDNARTAID